MHILAVDDEPAILELLQQVIQANGDHTVETASCVVDALDVLARPAAPRIDCFLIDIQMPDTDGIELCKLIRDWPNHKQTPILMLTAMTDKAYIDRAFAAGASDYITKPFEIDDLQGRIRLVEDSSAQSRNQADQTSFQLENSYADTKAPALHEPMFIQDVDGVITYLALENYISLMSRKKLFGSTVIGFTIRGIEELFEQTSRFEFECLITDVAEAISITLEDHDALIAYAGNGTYLCVAEGGWKPEPEPLADQVNLNIRNLGLYFNDGRPMTAAVSAGDAIRLAWKSGSRGIDALAAAHESAEAESRTHAINLEDFWYEKRKSSL